MGAGDLEDQSKSDLRERVRGLIAELPNVYSEARQVASELHRAFQSELAAAFQPQFNAYLKTLPQRTLSDKQALATHANSELRSLGLTIRCPKTGNPAILIADVAHVEHADASRFRVEARDERGHRVRSFTSSSVPDLELMEDPPRRESLSRGYRRRDGESKKR